jgi:serpin B
MFRASRSNSPEFGKAFVAVDEEGTEAAAATGVVIGVNSIMVPMNPRIFKVDHPFLFMLYENKAGTILFMGRVDNSIAG